ncbi:MAG: hypothetical protein Q7T70_03460 [Polaromonas sp.]|nr:hypothetical protein [Polaromonas sp.]
MPDIPLPKRVFGSETTRFIRPMRIGQEYVHVSELIGVRESGQLVLVNTREQIADSEGPVVETERVTVFMGDTPPGTKPAAVVVPIDAPWKETRVLDAIDLFRFSAFTVNAHRAHYDQEWTSEVEGYPALLVHGPLTAMLLLDFALRNLKGSPASYEVRAMAPLFVDERFQLLGCPTPDGADLWAISHSGIAMRAHLSMGAAA